MPNPPRSLVGKVLIKLHLKKSPPPTTGGTPDTSEAEGKVDNARQDIVRQLNTLADGIGKLYEPLAKPLAERLAVLREQLDTLGSLPSVQAKAHRLMQVKEAAGLLAKELTQAQQRAQQVKNSIDTQARSLTSLEQDLGAITVKSAHDRLENRLKQLQLQLDGLKAPATLDDLDKPASLTSSIDDLKKDIKDTKDDMTKALKSQRDLSTTPLTTFRNQLKGKLPATRGGLSPDLIVAEKKAAAVQVLIDTEQWSKVAAQAQKVHDACADMTLRMDELQNIEAMPEGDGKLKAKLDSAVARAKLTKAKLSKHKDFNTAFKSLHDGLDTKLGYIEWYAANLGTANKDDARSWLGQLQADDRRARRSLDNYLEYDQVRGEVLSLITALEKHAQSGAIQAELKRIKAAKDAAHKDGADPDKGWHCAKLALINLTAQCVQAKALADRLETQSASQPKVANLLKTKGLDPKYVHTAMKILVEEGCTPEKAVAMAEMASVYEGEGLDEVDASHSARVKQSLMDDDPKMTPQRAHAIGKLVRARGTAKGADLKAVAGDMKRMPEGAINALNACNVETVVCQGPVTTAKPELHEVVPRGWNADQTWDEVPGMGGETELVVGTMDDGAGGRKVPGPGEGPCPHGTPDLVGHEAGHTIDKMGGGNRRNLPVFVQARQEDVTLGAGGDVNGLRPIRDNYFMSTDETKQINHGGTVTAVAQSEWSVQTEDAARSESFAESFALHCQANKTKWPGMMKFWAGYTW